MALLCRWTNRLWSCVASFLLLLHSVSSSSREWELVTPMPCVAIWSYFHQLHVFMTNFMCVLSFNIIIIIKFACNIILSCFDSVIISLHTVCLPVSPAAAALLVAWLSTCQSVGAYFAVTNFTNFLSSGHWTAKDDDQRWLLFGFSRAQKPEYYRQMGKRRTGGPGDQ